MELEYYYSKLTVWQKAMDLAVWTYEKTKDFPKEEMYTLTSQMRRCAISIPSNIAEGHQRNSSKEFIRFLTIARGSQVELETQFVLCKRIGYLKDEDIFKAKELLSEIGKMLNGLIKRLSVTT